MPKRRNEEKIRRYKQKLRKLEEERRKYKRIISSSSDSENNSDTEKVEESDQISSNSVDQTDEVINESNATVNTEDQPPELDPEILTALGDAIEEAPKFGPNIHEKLPRLWYPILQKGLNKEAKEKLVKEYPIPENCQLLQAPKLNPEISAALADTTRARDKRVEAVQQQLGQGISALNKGLEVLFEDKDRLLAIKFLSDSCRILCDLHHTETEARKKFITPGLDKSFLNIIQEVDRDEFPFGTKLSEKIKATKIIEKQGLQIKKPPPIPKTSTSTYYHPSTSRSKPQGNWTGPPRFSSNRGGRGGQRSRSTPGGRKTHSAAFSQQKTAQTTQSKQPRATGQQ